MFIEKMPEDLDQYLRSEISKQLNGRLEVVLVVTEADAIMTGIADQKDGVGAAVTGRGLGLHDNATGSISLVDRSRTHLLWADEAGDRSLVFSVLHRGGPRKVASRLISKLKKAMS